MQTKFLNWMGLLLLLILLAACGDKIEPGTTKSASPGTVKREVGTVIMVEQPFSYTAVGSVEARTSSTISSKLMGTVRAIHVREGDRVKKGDVLVVIDDRQVSAGLDRADAGLAEAKRALQAAQASREAAKAEADLAKTTFERYKRLHADESISLQEFDEVSARYQKAINGLAQAEAMVAGASHRINQARAGLKSAKIKKKDVEIRAPYEGVITRKLVDIGDLASPGTPFFTLEGGMGFQVKLILPEVYIGAIASDQPLTVTVPSLADLTLKGTIETISPSADQRTRSFFVKVILPQNPSLRSGMFARVEIPIGRTGIITIPQTAVIEQGQLTGFYRVDQKNIAHFRLLRTGRTLGDRIEVVSGLKPDDRYIINPGPNMADGMTVEATP